MAVIAFYEQGWAALWLTPSLFFLSMRPTLTDWGFLLFLGIITTALAHTLFISSLKSIPARLAGVISSMEAVYGILLAFVLLGETPSLREIAGGTVIIGVVIFSQLQN